jgi:YegS/Rv2252/BmrU family lipid kinase
LKTRFIFNPKSGHNARNPYLLDRTRAFIAEHKLDATIVLTERPRHGTELARRAVDEGCERVVAIGGDGTLNEIAAALVGTDTALGLIPCGSGNGLGRHLGIPGPGKGAFRTLLDGTMRAIDTGSADGHAFFNVMGLGFDADLSARFNQLEHRGLRSYVTTTLAMIFRYQPESYVIRTTDQRIETRGFIVAVANSDQYGNDCYIAPGASVDDGLLDLTVLRPANLLHALPLLPRLFLGSIDGSRSVTRLRAAHFTIERSGPGLFHTDGETHACGPVVEISVRPRSLKVVVPPASAKA